MPAVYELLSICFPDARPDAFRRETECDSTFRWRHARVVEVDGAVVGYVRIFDRRMWLRGARLRAAGIGSVGTHPDYRRRGLATALLRDTLALLRREGYHLSFLGSEVAAAFYERLGWRVVRQPSHGAPAAEAAALRDRQVGLTIRPFVPSDLTAVARIHARATRGRTGAVARSLRYWSDHMSWMDDDAGGFLVAVSGGHGIAAFVRSRSERWASTLMVLDAHCRAGAEACLTPLLGALGRYAVSQGLKGIQASLPEGHPLAGAFAELPSAGMTTEVRFPFMMRVMNLPGLLQRLAPLLGERLDAMKASPVSLAFEEDGERTYLCVGPEGVGVARRPAGEVVPVAPGEAVTLLLGQQDVRDVLSPAAGPPSKEALSALEQLLPRQTLHFCNADGI
jgi:ribosomal protein S18 acetylase RimI-like enzyme